MRHMVWIETARAQGWGCSQCNWIFHPVGPPRGNCLDEMMRNYELQRDTECALHTCVEYPRPEDARDFSRSSLLPKTYRIMRCPDVVAAKA